MQVWIEPVVFLLSTAMVVGVMYYIAFGKRKHDKPKPYLQFSTFFNQIQVLGMTKIRIPVGYSQIVSVTPKDEQGNSAKVQKDSVEWSLSSEGVAKITETEDETKARIDIVAAGNVEARSSADSDLNEGPENIRPITGFIEVEGYEPDATSLDIQASGEIFKTPAPAPAPETATT